MSLSRAVAFVACGSILAVSCGTEVGTSTEPASETSLITASDPDSTSASSIAPSETAEAATPNDVPFAVRPPISLLVSTSGESGQLIDGEVVSDQSEGAFRWTSRVDLNAPASYGYFLREGQAEISDAGCIEVLQVDDSVYSRSAALGEPDAGSLFVPMGEADAAEIIAAFNGWTFPAHAEELFDLIDSPAPDSSAPGVYEAELGSSQVDLLIEAVWASWHFDIPASGKVVVTEDENGQLKQVVLDAAGTSDGGRSQSVHIEATVTDMAETMTVDSPRPQIGFCQ